MIRILGGLAVLCLLWSGYWFVAALSLQNGLTGWFQAQAARGWLAEFTDSSIAGFPMRHQTTLTAPGLADPQTGLAWRADWLRLDSAAIRPDQQTLVFPESPQKLSYFDDTLDLVARQMTATLTLDRSLALAVTQLGLSTGALNLRDAVGPVLSASGLVLSMAQTEHAPARYDFALEARDVTPGDGLRGLARDDLVLPERFETLALDFAAAFDRPWDRSALETGRPQPVEIDLRLAEARWGPLRLRATGAVDVDADGIPRGTLSVQAENWRDMLTLAEAAGALPSALAGPAETVLEMLANLRGIPDALDVGLALRDGIIALGPFPIGPAPRLILR